MIYAYCMTDETVAPAATYGIELIDALTNSPLFGSSALVTDAPPVDAVRQFKIGRARWIFENLRADVSIDVTADFYLSESITTGVAPVPAVPAAGQPGVFHELLMTPAPGYPFAATLTRVLGEVRIDASLDPSEPAVQGVEVEVIASHSGTETAAQTRVTTATGQYTVWFLPDPMLTPRLATAFRVQVQPTTIDVLGSPTLVEGSVPLTPLIPQAVTNAPVLRLTQV